jgi:hypothetical protein
MDSIDYDNLCGLLIGGFFFGLLILFLIKQGVRDFKKYNLFTGT